ncbi:MAG: penicillin-binding transpeptidase domain-containing protein, partial [Candidatus Sumerlaeia bacterium]|nr:penicillin-binding transpeptidase domain-containing protein [Candidatus Sumerlaeia bacterium]
FKPQWKVAGKTGTAQNATGGTDAWFIGFAPVNDPQVLVLVLIENGGHGGKVAAPIARDILDFYFSRQVKH